MTTKQTEALKLALETLEFIRRWGEPEEGVLKRDEAITALREALAEQPAQQEPVLCINPKVIDPATGKVRNGTGALTYSDAPCAGWSLPLYTSPQPARQHQCSRSHPHENMDAMCELRTEIARLTNENARLKARHQDDEINAYRMTLLCIRDGLQQGMSKSIQKLQAREINDVLGLPSFASYRTSPPASKPWVGLTQQDIDIAFDDTQEGGGFNEFARAIEAKLKEKNA